MGYKFALFLSLLVCQIKAQSTSKGKPSLYEQVLVAQYIGDSPKKGMPVQKQVIITKIGTGVKSWVRKPSPKPCTSSNPDDCTMLCLVEDTDQKETIFIVTDTIACRDFLLRQVTIEKKKEKRKAQ